MRWVCDVITWSFANHRGPYKRRVCLYVRNIKKCMGILKSLNIENLYRVMSMLKLKINVNLPQLLCIVVSAAQNGEFERFGGFCVDCCYTLKERVVKVNAKPNIPIHFFIFRTYKQTRRLYGCPVVYTFRVHVVHVQKDVTCF